MRWLVLVVVVVIGVLFWYDRSDFSVQIGQSRIETPIPLITPGPTFAPTPNLLQDITSEIHNKLNGVWKQENGVSRLEFGREIVFSLADFVDGTRSGNGTLYEKVDGDSNTYENTYELIHKKNTWSLHINWRRTSTSATYSYDVKGNTLILTDIATNEQYTYWNAGQLKGVWAGVGNSERLEFRDDGTLSRTLGESSKEYTYRLFDYDHLSITWRSGPSGPRSSYRYELKGDNLILTNDTGGRFVYLRELEPTKPGRQTGIGPHPITISGTLVGPMGVLGNQAITLNPRIRGFLHPEYTTSTITDAKGKFEFPNVKPEFDYILTFAFKVADPDKIPDGALVGDFVLSKDGSEITATSNDFYLTGFEDEKIIDFIYPSTPPPTVTPLPATATPTLDLSKFSLHIPVPTSTPTVQPTPHIWVNVRPRSQETTLGTPLLASMILEYYGENYTPEHLRELFIQKGKEAGRYPDNEKFYEEGGVFNQDMLDGVMSLGYNWKEECQPISGDEEFNQRRQQLVDSLTAGRPALIGLWSESSGYNVIVVGYDPATQMYTYLDPAQVSVSEEQLKQLWRQEVIDKSASIKTEDRCIIFTSPKS